MEARVYPQNKAQRASIVLLPPLLLVESFVPFMPSHTWQLHKYGFLPTVTH